MDIAEMINEIELAECANCRFGKLLVALKEVLVPDGEQIYGTIRKIKFPPPKKRFTHTVSVAVHQHSRAVNPNEDAILNYLKTHPDSKSREIAGALGLEFGKAQYALKILAKKGKAELNGRTDLARWNLSGGVPVVLDPESQTKEEKKFHCPNCPKSFRNLLNMQEHRELHHPEKK